MRRGCTRHPWEGQALRDSVGLHGRHGHVHTSGQQEGTRTLEERRATDSETGLGLRVARKYRLAGTTSMIR